MSRRRNSTSDDLILLPWWFSVILAGIVYWGAKYILPTIDFPGMFLNPFATSVSKLAPLLAGFFLLIALRSLFRRIKIGWQFNSQESVDSLNDLSWKEFEDIAGEFFRQRGYAVMEILGGGADGGVDLRLRKNGELILVQCKRWKSKKVGLPVVRELLGAITAESADSGIVIATSSFTSDAVDFAHEHDIDLIDGSQLIQAIGKLKPKRTLQTTAIPAVTDSPKNQTDRVPPSCPKCGGEMVERTARKGANAGNRFWGCCQYPRCRGLINR